MIIMVSDTECLEKITREKKAIGAFCSMALKEIKWSKASAIAAKAQMNV